MVIDALEELKFRFFNSVYNPVTVLWIFLGQVMHPNPTLATTVENFIAWRVGQGLPPCSPSTGAYSQARWRLPQRLLEMLTRQTGRKMECAAEHSWRWRGRAVKVFDGSTLVLDGINVYAMEDGSWVHLNNLIAEGEAEAAFSGGTIRVPEPSGLILLAAAAAACLLFRRFRISPR